MLRWITTATVIAVVAIASAPRALRAEEPEGEAALKARIADLEKRIADMEKLLKERAAENAPAGPGAQAEPRQLKPGPIEAGELPDWARRQLEELLERGVRGQLRVPAIGDMEVRTLPRARKAMLGVQVRPLIEEEARAANLASGVKVVKVSPDSPAKEAGVEEDDVILKVDDADIASPEALVEKIGAMEPGAKAKLTLLRKGVQFTATATLSKAEPERFGMQEPFGLDEDLMQELRRGGARGFRGGRIFEIDPRGGLRAFGDEPPEARVEAKLDTPDGSISASVDAPTLTLPDDLAKKLALEKEPLAKAREILAAARGELAGELNAATGKVAGGAVNSVDFASVAKKLAELEKRTDRDLSKILPPEQMAKYREWRTQRGGFSHSLSISRGTKGGVIGGEDMPQMKGAEVF